MLASSSHAHSQCPLDCRRCNGDTGTISTSCTDVRITTRRHDSRDSIYKAFGVRTSSSLPLREPRATGPCSSNRGNEDTNRVPEFNRVAELSSEAVDPNEATASNEKGVSTKGAVSTKLPDKKKVPDRNQSTNSNKTTTTISITSTSCSPSQSILAKGASLLAGLEEVRRNLVPVDHETEVVQQPANSVWSATWSDSQKAWFCILNNQPVDSPQEELNQIVPMIMHDVKSPLSTIQLCLEIVAALTEKHTDEQLARAVARARANAERVQNLADEVLLMEKIKSDTIKLEMKPVALQTVVLDCADTLAALGQEHNVEIEADNMETVVVADRLRLGQILQNLLGNAIRFSPRGSTVRISSEPCLVEEREFVRISVHDNGPGIPESMRTEIFQAFRQGAIGKSRSISYGLGLAICDRLVALQGGRIWVESAEDLGCTFHVELPR